MELSMIEKIQSQIEDAQQEAELLKEYAKHLEKASVSNDSEYKYLVLDENMKLEGWITSFNITQGLREGKETIADVMSPVEEIMTIGEEEPARNVVIAASKNKLIIFYSLMDKPKFLRILIICAVCSGSSSVRGALTIPLPKPKSSIAFLTGIGLTSQNIISINESKLSCNAIASWFLPAK